MSRQWYGLLILLVVVHLMLANDQESVSAPTDGAEPYEGYRALWTEPPESRNAINALNDFNDMSQNDTYSKVIFVDDVITARFPVLILVSPDRLEETEDFLNRLDIKYEVDNANIRSMLDRWEFDSNQVQKANYEGYREERGRPMVPNHYMTYDQLEAFLRDTTQGSSIAEVFSIGKSYEGRDTWAVKVNEHKKELPAIWIDAGLNPNKWMATAVASVFIFKVLSEDTDEARYLRDNFRWYIVPQLNPDGYVYTWTTDRFWRKTRSPQGECFGVDLNRNWNSPVWMNGPGASDDPCSRRYSGESIFSEVELRNIRDTMLGVEGGVQVYFGLFTHGQTMVVPGLGPGSLGTSYLGNEHFDQMEKLARVGLQAIKQGEFKRDYDFGTAFDVRYPRSATELDWVYWDKFVERFTGATGWRNSDDRPNIRYAYSIDLPPHPADKRNSIHMADPPTQIVPTGYEFTDGVHAMMKEFNAIKESSKHDEL